MRLQEIRKKREKAEKEIAKVLSDFDYSIGGATVASIKIIKSDMFNTAGHMEIIGTEIELNLVR